MGNKDELWNTLWKYYYDSFYYSTLYSELTIKWQMLDSISKISVAVTASSSAVAGWALWEMPAFKVWWLLIAGSASLISILHTTLSVSDKLKRYIKLPDYPPDSSSAILYA